MNRFPHFRVTIDGVPLHFLHVRGKGANPMPLLLIHGWPWTFMDFHELIGPLTDPAAHLGDAADAFDLIIPSLPGFGFSMPLTTTGLDRERTAELFWRLMTEVLGLSRFAVAGGDFGAVLTAQIAHAHPEQVIGLLATIPLIPGLLDLATFKPDDYATDEQWMISRKAETARSIVSHLTVHSHDPQTLAYALVDSPVGTAAWLWERRRAWSDCGGDLLSVHDRDFLCTLASIYRLTRTIGTSLRIYWEHLNSPMLNRTLHHRKPVIEVPTAYAAHASRLESRFPWGRQIGAALRTWPDSSDAFIISRVLSKPPMMNALAIALVLALGVVVPARAASDETLTIGFTVSQTGVLNVDSIAQRNGFDLWREDVNRLGGFMAGGKKYKIEFASYDDQSRTTRVQQLYSRLILRDRADFLFSPYSSGLTATAAVISEQYGKVMLTTGAAEADTYKLGNRYLFQIYTPTTNYLTSALDVIKQRNPKARIAFMYADDSFSKAVIGAAEIQAKERDLDVVLDEAYAPSTSHFGPIINKVISSRADTLIGGGHYADGATLTRQLHDRNVKLGFVCLLVAPDSPRFASLGDAALNVSVPSQWEPQVSYEPQFGPTADGFADEYKKRFGVEPGYHAAGGYAGGLVLEHAIEKAGSVDTVKVAAALNATNATIFFGRIKFATRTGDHGLQVGHAMVLAQWQKKDGRLVKEVVWPPAARTAALVYPAR